MSSWRDETSSDLRTARERIEALSKTLSGEPDERAINSIWMAYLFIEKSIVFIKVEIDEENPGRFIKIKSYRVPDERQALGFSLKNLQKGTESFLLGDYPQALKQLRESRNYLRVLLRQKRLAKLRRMRSH